VGEGKALPDEGGVTEKVRGAKADREYGLHTVGGIGGVAIARNCQEEMLGCVGTDARMEPKVGTGGATA